MSKLPAATAGHVAAQARSVSKNRTRLMLLLIRLSMLSRTPRALTVYHLAQAGDLAGLQGLSFDPYLYTWNNRSAPWFRHDYLLSSIIAKLRVVNRAAKREREDKAIVKWQTTEEACKITNEKFRYRWEGRTAASPSVEQAITLARQKISSILGTFSDGDLVALREWARHGPGSDLSLTRREATLYRKFSSPGEITPSCRSLYHDLFPEDRRADFAENARTAFSSKMIFVPKTNEFERVANQEARWNVYVQLGLGRLIAHRLLRVGIDLQDQTRNAEFARRAYREGLATVDLSSASDTISTNLVIDLLADADPLWLDLLCATRMTHIRIRDGAPIRLEKFSSMGNGFTFPLESLIFFALAWASAQVQKEEGVGPIGVYGDDIVIHRRHTGLLVEVLEYVGFTVNNRKSFFSGNFFESCGKDYYQGNLVRPIFHKEDIVDDEGWMRLHNQLVTWGMNGSPYISSAVADVLAFVRSFVPRSRSYFGPIGIDGTFWVPFDLARPLWGTHRLSPLVVVEGYIFKAIQKQDSTFVGNSYWGHLWSKLSSDLDSGQRVSARVPETRVRTICVQDYGEYIVV